MDNQTVRNAVDRFARQFKGVKPAPVAKVVQTCHSLLFADHIANPHRIVALLNRELENGIAEYREASYQVIGLGILLNYKNTSKGQNLTDARRFFARELRKVGVDRDYLGFKLVATDTVIA